MKTWTRIETGVVVELIELPDDVNPSERYHSGLVDGTISIMRDITNVVSAPQERWLYDKEDDTYSTPPLPPSKPSLPPTMTAADLVVWMKGQGRITDNDVVTMPQNMQDVINTSRP